MSEAKLVERLTRHQVFVQQFSGGQINNIMPILRQLAEDMRGRIASGRATEFQMGRIGAIREDLRALASQAASDIQGELELEEFAQQEVDFTERLLAGAVSVELSKGISADRLSAIVTQRPMQLISGETVKQVTIPQVFDEFSEAAGRDAMRKVQAGILEGRTQQDMARDVSRMVTGRTRQQAETLIRSATNHVGTVARDELYAANEDIIEGERFLATLDSRVTRTCASLDQTVHRRGEGPMPPLHFGCVLPDSHVAPSGGVSYVTKRPFNGEVVVIRTLGDRELTVTSNHPVMTDRGFVAAKLLNKGDRVVSSLAAHSLASGRDDDEMETRIEDRFDSLVSSGRMHPCPVPCATEDFHGDVTEDEVGVVLIDRELPDAMVSTIAHQFVKGFLKVAGPGALVDESAFGQFPEFVRGLFVARRCGVSFRGKSSDLLCGRIIHSGLLLLRSISEGDSVLGQKVRNDGGGDAHICSYASNTSSGVELADDLVSVERFVHRRVTGLDSMLFGDSIARGAADSGHSGDFRRLIPFAEEFDTVTDLGVREYSGHVYNLMCGDGVYSADGIITHNCRSIRVPVVKEQYRVTAKGERASEFGPRSNQLTYGGFLREQTEEFQNKVLGKRRADLFRSGQLDIRQFTDDRGIVLSLDELRQRYDITME